MKNAIDCSVLEAEDDGEVELSSGQSEAGLREGRFLLYWATTTSTSTTTTYTGTSTIASLECTPSSFTINSCG